MLSNRAKRSVEKQRDPVVVLAADDHFAMPLAATIRSALDSLAPDRKLRLHVLDGGLRDATKKRLEQSWPEDRLDITWVGVNVAALAELPTSGHVNRVAYFRILMPSLLPTDVRRVIYLDADLIVRRDLTQLWNCDLEHQLCLAVQDCAAPYIDASAALANYDQCAPHLGSVAPVANFRELGMDPMAAYFNSGVLLVDLAAWREADLSRQLLTCLDENKEHVLWWDQYTLNVVLSGLWGRLDPRWNQGAHVFAYPGWSQSPYDQETYQRLRDEPFIVHFTTGDKPWKVSCSHPLRNLFFDYVDRTAWAGWRPTWFNDPQSVLELIKTQERRFRHARRRMRSRIAQWWQHDRQHAQV